CAFSLDGGGWLLPDRSGAVANPPRGRHRAGSAAHDSPRALLPGALARSRGGEPLARNDARGTSCRAASFYDEGCRRDSRKAIFRVCSVVASKATSSTLSGTGQEARNSETVFRATVAARSTG